MLRWMLIFGALHLVATAVLFLLALDSSWTGQLGVAGIAFHVLAFPLFTGILWLAPNASLGYGVFAVLIANSLLWGLALAYLRERRRRVPPQVSRSS